MQYDELYHLEIKFFHTIGATKFWLHWRFILCWEQKRDSICPSLQFGIHSNFKSHGLHPGAHLNLISLKISKFLLIEISLSLLYIYMWNHRFCFGHWMEMSCFAVARCPNLDIVPNCPQGVALVLQTWFCDNLQWKLCRICSLFCLPSFLHICF